MHQLRTLTPGLLLAGLLSLLVLGFPETALAQENTEPQSVAFVVGNLWILMAAALVFMMHLGFATLGRAHGLGPHQGVAEGRSRDGGKREAENQAEGQS